MAHSWSKTHWLVCPALALGACGLEAIGTEDLCDDLSPGDLVLTEVHANPEGPDADGEYIEIFNASGARRSLDGARLVTSRNDGASEHAHRFAGLVSIGPGEYFVAGNTSADPVPDYVDYSYGSALGSLRNTDGVVSLWCGEQLIDQMGYERTTDGRALQLDGRLVADHERNDEAAIWCIAPEGTPELSPGNFGTPGNANGSCDAPMAESQCRFGDTVRAIVAPRPGEVRITEWMANPSGPDADFEWVEVVFEADADLNGFQLGSSPDALMDTVDGEACVPVDAGTRVVFGGSPAATPRVDAELRFSLGNSGARSIVAGSGGTVIDRVDYDETAEGVAWQLDSSGERCLSLEADEYLTGNSGTPGEANPRCPSTLSEGQCLDGGVARDVISPLPGQAFITEWMANPGAAGNREGEWVELRLDMEADLNGLALTDRAANTTELTSDDCLRVASGKHLLLVRSTDPRENGGITAVDGELSLSLNNSDETITLSVDGRVLDSIEYERASPGIATQIDEAGQRCDAMTPYGDGDLGTPGSANPPCF